jgi:VCBS repeat-containing protein
VKYPAPAPSFGLFQLSVVLRDVNGDGVLDVVGQAATENEALVWLGVPTSPGSHVGTGTFSAGTSVALNASSTCGNSSGNPCQADFPTDVAVGDFNGDGKPDLVTSNTNTNNLTVLLGNGDGTFGNGSYGAGTYVGLNGATGPQQVVTGLVDPGSNLDLVVADQNSGQISVLLGDGSGGFGTATNIGAGIARPAKIKLADVNHDGFNDIVETNSSVTGSAAVMLNDGSGGFSTPTTILSSGKTATSVSVADINGDGNPDLTFSQANLNSVLTLLGNGTGGFGSPLSFGLNGGVSPQAATVADLNGDGRPDVATANTSSGASDTKDVSVLLNTSNRAPLAIADSYSHIGADTALTVSAGSGVLANDTDADGNPLTAVLDSGPSNGTLTLNSDGSFTYQANSAFAGTDSFTYHATDGIDNSNTVTVTITTTAGCNGLTATITGNGTVNGTAGADVIVTGNGADTINGANGADTICSFGGNDTVNGGNQNDYIDGGDGNDIIDGGNDQDTLFGGAGNDTLTGSNANDTLHGGDGDDSLDGGANDDVLYGDAGNDTLTGSFGNDTLYGGDGDDNLSGGTDTDTVVGGAGSDVLSGGFGTGDVCAGDNNGGPTLPGTDSLAPSHGCETVVEVP